MRSQDLILCGDLLTERQVKKLKAAIQLAGTTVEGLAAQKGISANRVRKMIYRQEAPSAKYADAFNTFITRQFAEAFRVAA